jgi:peptidoglycan/LPS O-acetylase OafA/YrhL
LVHFKLASLRVLFSFFLGVAFYRVLGPNPKGLAVPAVCTPLIFTAFAIILFAPTTPERLYDLLAVFMGFPALLVLALRASPGTGRLRSVSLTFGSWSYPVYVLHVPILILIFEMFFSRSDSGGRALGMTLSLATVIALSSLLIAVYDQPARRWLSASRRYRF